MPAKPRLLQFVASIETQPAVFRLPLLSPGVLSWQSNFRILVSERGSEAARVSFGPLRSLHFGQNLLHRRSCRALKCLFAVNDVLPSEGYFPLEVVHRAQHAVGLGSRAWARGRLLVLVVLTASICFLHNV